MKKFSAGFAWNINFNTFVPLSQQRQKQGDVAQLVEQRTENPCVGGSIPSITTKPRKRLFLCNNLHIADCSGSSQVISFY
jgi:hypothetical protein